MGHGAGGGRVSPAMHSLVEKVMPRSNHAVAASPLLAGAFRQMQEEAKRRETLSSIADSETGSQMSAVSRLKGVTLMRTAALKDLLTARVKDRSLNSLPALEDGAPSTKMLLKQQGVPVACQTVRRGPYELDSIELQAIREGTDEVMQRLRMEGVIRDNDAEEEVPKPEVMERRFQQSRRMSGIGDRVEYMIDSDGVSGDSLGRNNKQISPLLQLQHARFMLRRQEERINELMRKGHAPASLVKPPTDTASKPRTSSASDDAVLQSRYDELRQQLTRRDMESEFMQKQIVDLQQTIASQRREQKASSHGLTTAQCMLSSLVRALRDIDAQDELRTDHLTSFVAATRDAVGGWCGGETEPRQAQMMPLDDLKQEIPLLHERLQGIDRNPDEDIADGVIYTEKQLVSTFRDAICHITGGDAALPHPSGDDLPSLHAYVLSFKAALGAAVLDAESCTASIHSICSKMELSRQAEVDEGGPQTAFSFAAHAMGVVEQHLHAFIDMTVEDRLGEAKNAWNEEVIALNIKRSEKEKHVLSKCNASHEAATEELKPLKRKRMQCLFQRILTRLRLRRLQKDLVLPRWPAFALRRMYCIHLVKLFVESNAVDHEIQVLKARHFEKLARTILPLYSHWADVPAMWKVKFTAGIQPQAPLMPYELWGALDEQLTQRAVLANSSCAHLRAALEATTYCRDLFEKNLRFLKNDEQLRQVEWKEIKALRRIRAPRGSRFSVAVDPLRHPHPRMSHAGAGLFDDSPPSPSPTSATLGPNWRSADGASLSMDKSVYASGKVGEEAIRRKAQRVDSGERGEAGGFGGGLQGEVILVVEPAGAEGGRVEATATPRGARRDAIDALMAIDSEGVRCLLDAAAGGDAAEAEEVEEEVPQFSGISGACLTPVPPSPSGQQHGKGGSQRRVQGRRQRDKQGRQGHHARQVAGGFGRSQVRLLVRQDPEPMGLEGSLPPIALTQQRAAQTAKDAAMGSLTLTRVGVGANLAKTLRAG